ncbi:MAG: acetyl-CoA carboxylase biotin carboxylase subunit [Bacteroidetes bacterium]|nr:acetyl-CoA carboxylase biotin carboxylase subunit [Bacteroidota bacterium]
MFKKILIANRGEIALRIIRTCHEMGIKTVAVYSTADKESLHVKFADEAVCIGPPQSNQSYLKIANIIAAAEVTNTDAIHPGYGFLSENSNFAKICKEHNIKFIGPDIEAINKMGDKSTAKETMEKAGIPIVPGSKGLLESLEQAKEIANQIKFPIILKATAGGGGKGMRIVNNPSELEKSWQDAKREAKASFSNDGLYMEKFIEDPRHIEIQILTDQFGNVSHLSERDCSIQRRHQKLIEETPSPFIDQKMREKMGEVSLKACKYINYEGGGTIEFLVDKHHNFYFMEMNTRIQVEHPITEQVTNIDLIKEQIKVAAGEKIENKNYYPQSYSIECRINAEDPNHNFRPCPGIIKNLHLPGGHGIRVDTHVYSGYQITPYYDSMIAKLISTGPTREEAIKKMVRALNEFIIEGIKTIIPLHLKILNDKDFIKGNFTTKFLEIKNFSNITQKVN